jgi:hypothetical protein
VGAPVTLGRFALTEINQTGTLDRLTPHQGVARDERERLESNNHEYLEIAEHHSQIHGKRRANDTH